MRAPRTTADLIRDVKLDMFWPTTSGQAPFTDTEILQVAQRVLEKSIYPAILKSDPSLLEAAVDLSPIVAGVEPNQAGSVFLEGNAYRLPRDAMLHIRSVSWVEPNGQEYPLEIWTETEWFKSNASTKGNQPAGCAIRGNTLLILPHPETPVQGQFVRVRYTPRPLEMVEDGATAKDNLYSVLQVADLDTGYAITRPGIVLAEDGSALATSDDITTLSSTAPHVPLDFVGNNLSFGLSAVTLDGGEYILEINEQSQNLTSTTPLFIKARQGDFVCANHRTTLIQVPHEYYQTLVDGTAAKFARARRDRTFYAMVRDEFRESLEDAKNPMRRVTGQALTVTNPSGPAHRRIKGNWRSHG